MHGTCRGRTGKPDTSNACRENTCLERQTDLVTRSGADCLCRFALHAGLLRIDVLPSNISFSMACILCTGREFCQQSESAVRVVHALHDARCQDSREHNSPVTKDLLMVALV